MLEEFAFLSACAFAGGVVNSVAGGGTLLTFPALVAVLSRIHGPDEGAVWANGTSTVALFPGTIGAVWGFRRELATAKKWLAVLIGPSLVGGLVGSLLVTRLPAKSFNALVPWLILTAAVLFALQPLIARWIGIGKPHDAPTGRTVVGVTLFQFLVALYGGYFGAGIGILMLSSLAMMGLADIHVMNGLKSTLAGVINGMAAVVFLVEGKVDPPRAGVMAVAGLLGGYAGASVSRKLNRTLIRWVVICIGFSLATYYFYRRWCGTG